MKVVVEITWDKPEEQAWLCADNVAVALHTACKNTKFQVREVDPDIEKFADAMRRSFPYCEEHRPGAGTRTGCLICAMVRMSEAFSKIDYLCGEPNDMEVSGYDVFCDEGAVVEHVRSCIGGARKKETSVGCDHRWVYEGHGHNYSVYSCSICGAREER